MVAAFVSHFAEAYFHRLRLSSLTATLWRIGMLASPTFLIISGCMLGLLYETHRPHFKPVRARYLDRGLFLLTVGRLLIAIAHLPHTGLGKIVDLGFVTDAIGFSFIVSALLMDRLGPRGRLRLGIALYVAAWVVIRTWHPQALGWATLKEFVIGPGASQDPHVFLDDFPLVPWLGIYLCGTALGQSLARARAEGLSAVQHVLGRLVVAMALSAAALVALGLSYSWALGRAGLVIPEPLSPFRKVPPGPVYALGYGGLGLGFLLLFLRLEQRSPGSRLLMALGVFGRSSLFVFILQYFVFFTGFEILSPPYSPWWPLWLAASIVAMWFAARAWDRRGLNRLLTLGLAGEKAVAS